MALKENTKIDQIAYKPKPYRIKKYTYYSI